MLMEVFIDNYLVTKSNDLIEASYKLNLNEQKLILTLASTIQPEDKEFKPYQFNIKKFMDLFEIKNRNTFDNVKKITQELLTKQLTVNTGKSTLQATWLSSAEYFNNTGIVELCFDPKLKSFFLKLKERFTSYQLKNIVQLKSSYSIRIYELLKQYEKMKERIISIEDIKNMLGIEINQYSRYSHFKTRVLKQAYKEINEKTDISFEFEEIKNGRKVEKIKFIIKPKKVCTIDVEDKKEKKVDPVIEANIQTLKALFNIVEVNEKDILSILDAANNDMAKVIEKYYIIRNKKDINNFTGLMIEAIKNDYNEIVVTIDEASSNKNNIKTKFHNFEQRTNQYTPKELEKMVLENNKKKFEK